YEVNEYEGTKTHVAGFEGRAVINRTEFGVGASGGIGENVKIAITLEAGQKQK
ncbi:MAG: YceI family protein, partial [Bacteroidia bacterium]